jgi:hypothetical protein
MEFVARPNPFESARNFVTKGGMPMTIGTLVVASVMFVAWWSGKNSPSWYPLIFESDGWWMRPWSLVTYAFMEDGFGRQICSGLVTFFFMGAVERAWAKGRFLPAYALLVVLPPLALWLGHLASGVQQMAMGLWLPTACWTVVYGSYRPEATILLFAIIPVKAKWLAWIAALGVVFVNGYGAPVAGLLAGLAPLAAWALGSRRLTLHIPERKAPAGDEFRKSMKTKRDAEHERLKLRELLERSVADDRDDQSGSAEK